MERRSFLRIAGGVTPLLLAGCTRDDEDLNDSDWEEDLNDSDWEEDLNDSDWEEDLNDSDWVEDWEEEDFLPVTVIEDELVVEGGDVTVEGVVENDSGERLTYVKVVVWAEDEDGSLHGFYEESTTGIDDGETWAFEVKIPKPPEKVADYGVWVDEYAPSDRSNS